MTETAEKPINWYHVIDLPDGTTTPGQSDLRTARDRVEWPAAIQGGRCLDVGTFDGFWAFEMERQGAAEVVGYDIDDPALFDWPFDYRNQSDAVREAGILEGRGFHTVAEALGSSARRVCGSVYDLHPDDLGTFDVVVCGALLLHLRDPINALEAMRGVCRGELVLVENLDPLLDLVLRRVPCAQFAPESDKWWRANSAGIGKMLDRAGFELVNVSSRFIVPHGDAPPLLNSVAAGQLNKRGGLHRVFTARPRPPRG